MKSISFVIVAALLATACSSMTAIGQYPSSTPPKLVRMPGGALAWDKPGAFGPVPQSMAAKGAAVCATLSTTSQTFRALGYHPSAQNEQGQAIAGGGFYCVTP